ncbi:unnamed protein product [Mytilus edulis]|uniref:Novel STAND NTPase 3 domain-containing protein n=1 Tax=Mytilus edulis TaxID=6550 RepID=A0A8S3S2L5_MYTED|nr:unnamed protein product [Mytilus edulis]
MVPSDLVCTVSASLGIDIRHLSDQLSKVLLERCCPLRKTIEKLILIRNKIQGHAIKGRISDADYGRYKLNITSGIMEIAKVCKNEVGTKQSLSDVSKRSLDETLCIQYHDMLLEQIKMETRLEERIDDIAVQIPKTIEEAVSNAFNNKIPDIVEQSVQLTLKKLKEPNSILTTEDPFISIKCFSSEDTFVETDVISMALTQLEDNGVIVLTGTAGAGKSRNSLEIIRRFSAGHNGYCGIKLNGICDWIEIINDNDCLVVLLDDIFGRTNCIFNAEDEKYFDNIHSMVVQGFVKVIFTMRNTIRSDPQVSDTIDRQRIFQKSRFIDLSSVQIEMKETQKRECLLKYCKLNNIGISDPYQFYDEKDFLDPLVPIYLSDQDIYEISNIDINPLMGYPESCFLFASNRKFTRLGIGFFKHPTQSLCSEIERLRNDGHNDHRKALEYAILVYMALNEDMLNLKNINITKFNRIYELVYHKKELTAKNICRGLKDLTKRYLKTNIDGTYSFQHRSIFEGVLLSYNDIETDILIPLLHIDFIMEIGRLEGYKPQPRMENEITLLFKKNDYSLLAQKIIKELGKNILTKTFMERLCSSKVIRNADGYFFR